MRLSDDLRAEIINTFKARWSKRAGLVVPEPNSLSLSNDAVEIERATILYADLSGSTQLVDSKTWQFSAEVYKTFLYCAARIIRNEGGEITAYDGDRIMGVFIGNRQSNSAVKCALKIHYAVTKLINPAMVEQYPETSYAIEHVIGIDTSPVRVARTGVRGDNDLVWIGRAANYAAKLTELKLAEKTFITAEVYSYLEDSTKLGGATKQNMWKRYTWSQQNNQEIYGSTWYWKF